MADVCLPHSPKAAQLHYSITCASLFQNTIGGGFLAMQLILARPRFGTA